MEAQDEVTDVLHLDGEFECRRLTPDLMEKQSEQDVNRAEDGEGDAEHPAKVTAAAQ
jgi:hypothetical protein